MKLRKFFDLTLENVQKSFQLKIQTVRISQTSFWSTGEELKRLYEGNPLWAELEKELCGDLELP
ncbi:hypothetical protein [Aestuariivirga sp.]|jgi:hypothetical protein|uniref:hypothetical protein n=1 Tax=Aestuariivirga sp. TaxID=2650926 RepID=UPI003784628B